MNTVQAICFKNLIDLFVTTPIPLSLVEAYTIYSDCFLDMLTHVAKYQKKQFGYLQAYEILNYMEDLLTKSEILDTSWNEYVDSLR